MAVTDRLPTVEQADRTDLRPVLYAVALLPALLGIAHHVDHIIRGNHVGWPVTAHVNAFTYSLAIYPLLAAGLYLTATERVGARYWTGFLTASAGMLAYFHVSPWAIEPPQDVILPYASPLAGYLAFAVVLALIGSVALGAVYTAILWRRGEA